MSDDVQGEQQQADGGNSGYTPPATQEELNRVINDRIKRERAKYADYDDLRGKAAQLAKIEESSKTEAERAQERINAAELTVAKVPQLVAEQLRTHLIAMHSIPDDDAELLLTATDPELLLKQVDRLVGRQADSKKKGNFVAREGHQPEVSDTEERVALRGLFGG